MSTLSPERWKAGSRYLDQALEMPADKLPSWLETIRRQDPTLAGDLETLIGEHRAASKESFLAASPGAGALDAEAILEKPGDRIGRYTLVETIEFCDQQRLTLRQRLELFLPVCEAVQHAHLKGIIHRDIKPSNVLVAISDGGVFPRSSTSASPRRSIRPVRAGPGSPKRAG